MTKRKPYESRSDLEKIQSQWNKLTGLHGRDEPSAAIVRAATAAELAATFAIRKEFAAQSKLDPEFVNRLLTWANGLAGKLDRLLIPLSKDERRKAIKSLLKSSQEINDKRNAIVHSGAFSSRADADLIVEHTKTFIEALVCLYEPDFKLKEKEHSGT